MRGDKPGVVVLCTAVGRPDFVQAWSDKRLREERRLLEELPHLPDLQCVWLLLLLCASPRANHALRTLPPSEAAPYARGHDQTVWEAFQQCLGEQTQRRRGRSLPYRLSMVGSACSQPNALRQQHTGQHGWTRCRSSAPGPLPRGFRARKHWRAGFLPAKGSGGTQPSASGRAAPRGAPPTTAPAHHTPLAARLAASCDADAQSLLLRSRVVAFPATGFQGTSSLARRATWRGLAGSSA